MANAALLSLDEIAAGDIGPGVGLYCQHTSAATRGEYIPFSVIGHLDTISGSDADTTMAVGTLYTVNMSAWATANRTYTLPTSAKVGERIGILVTSGNASYELLITAGTSDTLNGVAGGTEWSRLMMTNELVIMRCITADSAWIVEYDGRIPITFAMQSNNINQNCSTSYAKVTWASTGGETLYFDNSGGGDITNDRFTFRRGGARSIYHATGALRTSFTAADAEWINPRAYINGSLMTNQGNGVNTYGTSSFSNGVACAWLDNMIGGSSLAVDDYLEYWVDCSVATGQIVSMMLELHEVFTG